MREVGAIEEGIAAAELYGEMRRAMRSVSNVAGLRRLSSFPYFLLRRRQDGEAGEGGSTSEESGDGGG